MWIVRLALRRPYTFVVMAILIFAIGIVSIDRTPTDIFPNIDIPVVSIIWNYNGLVPEQMADRIVSITERNLTTVVDNVQHVESQSLYGIAVVKVFLQPNAASTAQSRRSRQALKPSSGSCPRAQLRLSSSRTALRSAQGRTLPRDRSAARSSSRRLQPVRVDIPHERLLECPIDFRQ